MEIKRKYVSIAAVFSLAAAIALNIAAFSVLNGLVLRPLPFNEPDRLVELSVPRVTPAPDDRLASYRPIASLSGVAAWTARNFAVARSGVTEGTYGFRASGNLFEVLGVRPAFGPGFSFDDEKPGMAPKVMLSDAYWRRMSADPNVIGSSLMVDGRPHTIVGVLAPDFSLGVRDANVFVAERMAEGRIVARLAAGVSIDQADAAVRQVAAAIAPPVNGAPVGPRVQALSTALRSNSATIVIGFQVAVLLVLVITCANVASLTLVRGQARRREFVIRQAIGASRRDLAAQVIRESIVVAVAGLVIGVALAAAGLNALEAALPANISRALSAGGLTIDWRVALFAAGLSFLAVLGFGVVPAWRSSNVDVASALRESSRGVAPKVLGQALTVAEIAIAFVLVCAAGLTLKNVAALERRDLGFARDSVLASSASLPAVPRTSPEERGRAFDQLAASLANVPGVAAAGVVAPQLYPFGGVAVRGARFEIPGWPDADARAEVYSASPDYFNAVEIPLVAGRAFTTADVLGSAPVAIVSVSVARRYWGDRSPVGLSIRLEADDQRSPMVTIVGVVGDVRNPVGLQWQPTAYRPFAQRPYASAAVMIRAAAADPAALIAQVRPVIQTMNPAGPAPRVSVLASSMEAYLAPERFSTNLFAAFAIVGLILALVGVYGVTAHWVSARIPEIGLRIALGAGPYGVMALVVRRAVRASVIGIVLGGIAVVFARKTLAGYLHDVTPTDPAVLAVSGLGLLVIVIVAAMRPARRAAVTDPVQALR